MLGVAIDAASGVIFCCGVLLCGDQIIMGRAQQIDSIRGNDRWFSTKYNSNCSKLMKVGQRPLLPSSRPLLAALGKAGIERLYTVQVDTTKLN